MSESGVVYVNGKPRDWRAGITVAGLVAGEGRAPSSVATAVNGEFVARARRELTPLQPGDQLTLIVAIVGG